MDERTNAQLTDNRFCDFISQSLQRKLDSKTQFQLVLASMKDTLYDSSGVKATITFVNGATAFQWQLRAHSQPRSFRLHVCEAQAEESDAWDCRMP